MKPHRIIGALAVLIFPFAVSWLIIYSTLSTPGIVVALCVFWFGFSVLIEVCHSAVNAISKKEPTTDRRNSINVV